MSVSPPAPEAAPPPAPPPASTSTTPAAPLPPATALPPVPEPIPSFDDSGAPAPVPMGALMSRLRGVFYSEFDNVVGPKICYQAPDGYLSAEAFDSISDYVITKPQLCGKLITVTAFRHRIMGFPVNIENEKYTRNALMFNVGFVFDEATDTTAYEAVLRRLASVLQTLELESEFLSRDATKEHLSELLPRVLYDLNARGEVVSPINDTTTLCLKLYPRLAEPGPVAEQEVPVRIRDLDVLVAKDWDLTLQRIIPYIDGVNYVKRISILADVDLELVNAALRQLLYYGCVAMIDIFQYSNIYATTPAVGLLLESAELADACTEYITKYGWPRPPFARVFSLYCSFQAGYRTCDVCALADTHGLGIDDRRFVAFGVIHGLLRRVHKYPVPISGAAAAAAAAKAAPSILLDADTSGTRGMGSRDDMSMSLSLSMSMSGLSPAGVGGAFGSPGSGAAVGFSDAADAAAASAGSPARAAGSSAFAVGSGGATGAGAHDDDRATRDADRAADEAGATDRATVPSESSGAAVAGASGLTSGVGAGDVSWSGVHNPSKKSGASSSKGGGERSGGRQARFGPDSGFAKLLPLLDGKHSMDEICCTLMRSHAEVDTMIRANGHFAMIHKS